MMFSINHPAENDQNKACFYVKGEELMLGPKCQYFIAHVPGFSRDRDTISLESYCKRGYFLRQNKYGFFLVAMHASLNFGKCAMEPRFQTLRTQFIVLSLELNVCQNQVVICTECSLKKLSEADSEPP